MLTKNMVRNGGKLYNTFSENAKTATVRPIFKEGDGTEIQNYRPVSLLNILTKIYERILY